MTARSRARRSSAVARASSAEGPRPSGRTKLDRERRLATAGAAASELRPRHRLRGVTSCPGRERIGATASATRRGGRQTRPRAATAGAPSPRGIAVRPREADKAEVRQALRRQRVDQPLRDARLTEEPGVGARRRHDPPGDAQIEADSAAAFVWRPAPSQPRSSRSVSNARARSASPRSGSPRSRRGRQRRARRRRCASA